MGLNGSHVASFLSWSPLPLCRSLGERANFGGSVLAKALSQRQATPGQGRRKARVSVSWLELNLRNMLEYQQEHTQTTKTLTLAGILFTASHIHTVTPGFEVCCMKLSQENSFSISIGNVIRAPSHYVVQCPTGDIRVCFYFNNSLPENILNLGSLSTSSR